MKRLLHIFLVAVGFMPHLAAASSILSCPDPKATETQVTYRSFVSLDRGRLLLTGDFMRVGGAVQRSLAVLDPQGRPELAGVPEAYGAVHQAKRGPDGHIYVVGAFDRMGATHQPHLVRLIDGPEGLAVDSTWRPELPPGSSAAVALAVGTTHAYVGVQGEQLDVVEFSLTTGAQTRLLSPAQSMQVLHDLAVDEGEQTLIVAGYSSGARGNRPFQAIDLATGLADADWTLPLDGAGSGQAVLADGAHHWLLGGNFSLVGGAMNLVRADASGSVDAGFASHPAGPVAGMQRMDDGRLLVHGSFDRVGPLTLASGAAILRDDGAAEDWNAGAPSGTTVQAALALDDGRVLTAQRSVRSSPLVWLDAATGQPDGLDLVVEGPAHIRAGARVGPWTALVGGDGVHGHASQGLVLLNADLRTVILPALGEPGDRVIAATPVRDGLVLVRRRQGSPDTLVRFTLPDLMEDTAWTALSVGSVEHLVYDPEGDLVYAMGAFDLTHEGQVFENILRVHASGTGGIDAQWRPVGFPRPGTSVPMVIHGRYGYALEGYGVFRIGLDGVGSVDPLWQPDLHGAMQPYALGVDHETREIVAAGTDSAGATLVLGRLGTSLPATVATFAHSDIGATVAMHDVEAGPDGRVVVAGAFRAGLPSLLRFRDGGRQRDALDAAVPAGSVRVLVGADRGRVMAAGFFHSVGEAVRGGVVAYGGPDDVHRDDFEQGCAPLMPSGVQRSRP